jgi:hypothetical protein
MPENVRGAVLSSYRTNLGKTAAITTVRPVITVGIMMDGTTMSGVTTAMTTAIWRIRAMRIWWSIHWHWGVHGIEFVHLCFGWFRVSWRR